MPTTTELIAYLSQFVMPQRLQRIVEISQLRTRHITVVLENLYQAHNISAILRTAECLGLQDVHLIENSFEYQISEQVALGAQKWLTINRYNSKTENNTLHCIEQLKKKGYRILATLPHEQETTLENIDISQPLAFVFGTELDGLTSTAIENADGFVKIPMYGFTESYNVSVSAALILKFINDRLRQSDLDYLLPENQLHELQLQWLKACIRNADKVVERYVSGK
ncbi:MAG: RNA methyltransferase [Bacteroidales bacterium]|jgi:tRNA (guanosine-2'-O-)-methyltransferase|nr:RNA methyltransferase [Bacteroidales bacterium]